MDWPGFETPKDGGNGERGAEPPAPSRPSFSSPAEGRRQEGESVPLWLITFTDIMALMLTFFVLLYSMAVPKEDKWSDVTSVFRKEFGQNYTPPSHAGDLDTISIGKLELDRALDLDYLGTIVKGIIDNDEDLRDIVMIPQRDRLVLSLPSALLFESGRSDVKEQGRKVLFSLGGPLSRIPNRVEVVGHTDPRPIQERSGQFDSNWELSLVRAANAAAVLEDVGYDRPIIVRGLSSGRYDELPEDMDEEKRLSLSRRVDIVIMKDDGRRQVLFEQ